jgi:hypothetical protein
MTLGKQQIGILCMCLAATLGSMALFSMRAEAAPGLPATAEAKAEKTLSLKSEISGTKVEFSCVAIGASKAPMLEAGGKGSGTLRFSGCQTLLNGVVSTSCEPLAGGTEKGVIASKALNGLLTLHEGSTSLLRVQPVEGETFGIVEMGKLCAIGTKVPVIGSFYAKDSGGELEVEKKSHVLETGPLTELWVISKTTEHKATAGGSVGLSLIGEHLGMLWSGLGGSPEWMLS